MGSSKTEEVNVHNNKYFADITHKKTSGANNWAKFAEVLKQEKHNRPKNPLGRKNQGKQKTEFTKGRPKGNFQSKIPDNIKLNNKSHVDPKNFLLKGPASKTALTNQIPKKVNVTNYHKGLDNARPQPLKPVLTKHIAMDCEMVGVEIGVNKNMLARISVVNSHGDCIYDKFVKPTEPVLDYRTRVSGVRPKDLETAADFKTVQMEIANMLKGRILVGHALKNDLKVLYLSHPKHLMRDTSKFKKFREGRTPALKKLAKKYLGVTIQEGEHSSIQDALAAMQLYKMFKKEWESSIFSNRYQVRKSDKSKPSQETTKRSAEVT